MLHLVSPFLLPVCSHIDREFSISNGHIHAVGLFVWISLVCAGDVREARLWKGRYTFGGGGDYHWMSFVSLRKFHDVRDPNPALQTVLVLEIWQSYQDAESSYNETSCVMMDTNAAALLVRAGE